MVAIAPFGVPRTRYGRRSFIRADIAFRPITRFRPIMRFGRRGIDRHSSRHEQQGGVEVVTHGFAGKLQVVRECGRGNVVEIPSGAIDEQ
jgi:hypothetical protein